MYCYHCNSTLDLKKDSCPKCGRDVRLFKKIVMASNRKYNDALAKAEARDLSGAAEDLKESLHLYKKNVQARNLYGLVLYAKGESVEALREWQIARNLSSTPGLSERFLTALQKNMRELNSEANSIRRYNQALQAAQSGAKDMAVIQLKKVISSHPNMTKAYELLALLYMESGKLAQAEQVLRKCLEIDRGDVNALRYLKQLLKTDPSGEKRSLGTVGTEDREQLIIPVRFRDYGTYLSNALYILLGLVLGILIAWFVIVPARVSSVTADLNSENGELMAKLESYQRRVDEETADLPTMHGGGETREEESHSDEPVIEGAETMPVIVRNTSWVRNQQDVLNAVEDINSVPIRYAQTIFEYLRIEPSMLSALNQDHYKNLTRMLFDEKTKQRIEVRAINYENAKDYENAALYYEALSMLHPEEVTFRSRAGQNYEKFGDTKKAANFYWQAAILFPETEYGRDAATRYARLTGNAILPGYFGDEPLENFRKPIDPNDLLNQVGGGELEE